MMIALKFRKQGQVGNCWLRHRLRDVKKCMVNKNPSKNPSLPNACPEGLLRRFFGPKYILTRCLEASGLSLLIFSSVVTENSGICLSFCFFVGYKFPAPSKYLLWNSTNWEDLRLFFRQQIVRTFWTLSLTETWGFSHKIAPNYAPTKLTWQWNITIKISIVMLVFRGVWFNFVFCTLCNSQVYMKSCEVNFQQRMGKSIQ